MKVMFTHHYGSWISKAIVYFTETENSVKPCPSHCLPIIDEGKYVTYGLSADELMVNIVDIDRYRDPNIYAFRIYELPDKIDPKLYTQKFIEKYNQVNYGWFDLLWFIPRKLFGKFWKLIRFKNPIDMGQFCSEISNRWLLEAGYATDLIPNDTHPNELELRVIELGGKLIEEQKLCIN